MRSYPVAYMPISVNQMLSRKLSDNLYLIDLKPAGFENFIASYVLKGQKAAIIETGPSISAPNLLTGLEKIGIQNEEIQYVAVSHIHIDHAGGAGSLLPHLPNAKLVVHERGAPHMVNPQKLWEQSKLVLGEVAELYGEILPVPESRVITPVDGMTLNLGEHVGLKILETGGHASHHMSFYTATTQGIFPGDAAGIYLSQLDVTIPTAPAPLHLEYALAAIEKLMQIEPRWLYYTHFGPADNPSERLNAYAGQLKLWARTILESMKNNEDAETIYEKILQRDPAMNTAADFIKNHFALRRGVVMQNIQGFIQYFKKKYSSLA